MNLIDIFPWDDNFNMGVPAIDEQHKKLVELLNRLASHIVFHSDLPATNLILDELAAYAVYHFETEEDIWHSHFGGDPLEINHKESHQSFIAKVLELQSDTEKPAESLLGEVLSFLTRWLAAHILQSDRYLAMVVLALQSGLPLPEATKHADEEISGATKTLIEIILAVYQKLSSNALELMREVAARRRSSAALAESQMQLQAVIDSTSDMIWSVDAEHFGLLMFNRGLRDYFLQQRSISIDLGMRPEDLLANGDFIQYWQRLYQRAMREGPFSVEYQVSSGNCTLQLNLNPLRRNGLIYGVSVFGKDITERKVAEESIHHLAFYDPLTHLPNRRLFQDRLRQAIPASDRHNSYGALLFIDLDHFKVLNDTRGHDFSDLLLVEVAKRLQGIVREDDTVARLSGDEFVVMLSDLGDRVETAIDCVEAVAEKILHTTSEPYCLRGEDCHNTVSIGACLFRGAEASIDDLLKRADTALYQAKQDGRHTVRFYDPAMQTLLESRVSLESWLRGALPEQFVLHYQLQVDHVGQIFGAEALIRWQHPEQGLIAPARFIPLAEETGQILAIGDWVLENACKQLKRWEGDQRTRALQLSVNVSAKQFHQPDFVERLQAVLDSTGADPSKLKLELTESMLIKDINGVISKMTTLRDQGVSFSLDDFGTGYSSLSYLKRLPLDQVKIDQSFVRDVMIDPNDAAIARTIVALGQSLGLTVIAEGVETEEQRDFLAGHGCTHYQGYLFSRPVPLAEFERLLD